MQQTGTKDVLDRRVVKPYRHHRCTPMHQTALPCPPRHCGRAVALPQDVLTMASHTTDGNPRPMAPPEPPAASAHDGAIVLSLVGGQQQVPTIVRSEARIVSQGGSAYRNAWDTELLVVCVLVCC